MNLTPSKGANVMMRNLLKLLVKENVGKMNNKEVIDVINMLLESTHNDSMIAVCNKAGNISFEDLEDVLYISNPKKNIYLLGKLDGEIEHSAASDFLEDTEKRFPNFRPMNRELIVNTRKMAMYDSYYRRVYFTETIFVSVTGAAINSIERNKLLDKSKDLSAQRGKIEYAPLTNKDILRQ